MIVGHAAHGRQYGGGGVGHHAGAGAGSGGGASGGGRDGGSCGAVRSGRRRGVPGAWFRGVGPGRYLLTTS